MQRMKRPTRNATFLLILMHPHFPDDSLKVVDDTDLHVTGRPWDAFRNALGVAVGALV
jgi:hypothetical protein